MCGALIAARNRGGQPHRGLAGDGTVTLRLRNGTRNTSLGRFEKGNEKGIISLS